MSETNAPLVSVLWFGTGSMTQELLPLVRREGVHILAFIDERKFMHDKLFNGAPVIDLEDIADYDYEYILVSARPHPVIAEKLQRIGVSEDKIIPLDFESHMYDILVQKPSYIFDNVLSVFASRHTLNKYINVEKIKKTNWYKAALLKLSSTYLKINRNITTIKIITGGGYGDVLITSAFIKELYKYIDIKIKIDVITRFPEIFTGHVYIRNIYRSESSDLDNYDVTISIKTKPACLDCRISVRDARFTSLRNMLDKLTVFNDKYKRYHTMDNYPSYYGAWANLCMVMGWNRWDMLGASGIIPFSRNTRAFAPIFTGTFGVLQTHGLDDAPYITVHTGVDIRVITDHAPKIWPKKRWREFCRLFKQYYPDILLVQLGAAHSPRIEGTDLCLLGKTSMSETRVILKHALLHVDGDSGLVHLRRQLGGKSVVMFGPTPVAYYGYPQNKNIVAKKCGNCMWLTDDWFMRCIKDMDIPECMLSINAQTVLLAVDAILSERQNFEYTLSDVVLYSSSTRIMYEEIVSEFCYRCGLENKPISEYIFGECGIHVLATKQWEYPYAVSMMQGLGSHLKIADVGSGRGALSLYLARLGHDVTAYDFEFSPAPDDNNNLSDAAKFIRFAANQGFTAEFGDIFNLPVDDGAFDVVTCISVVEHVTHKFYAVKEMLRVLKPGGKLILTYDLAENPVDMETGNRCEIFDQNRIESLLREFGITPETIYDTSALRRSIADMQADNVRGMPCGLTVGGLVLTKTLKAPTAN
jgi:ADP-heptose:LPS heptosyltransferase/SAM-dependent methyltransferase